MFVNSLNQEGEVETVVTGLNPGDVKDGLKTLSN